MTQQDFLNLFDTGANIFLTGEGGTGKSYILREAISRAGDTAIVVAPTGIAAINVGGATMHSTFGLPLHPHIPGSDLPHLWHEKIGVLRKCATLFIDEISMVRADMLDAVDQRLREVRHDDRPFGGVQVVLCGDPYQLEPVVKDQDASILRTYYKTTTFNSARCFSSFKVVGLTHNYRQSDEKFTAVLNKIRKGEPELDLINERCCGRRAAPGTIIMASTNALADGANDLELRRLLDSGAKSKVFSADITGKFSESEHPVPENILLCEGAQVMVTRNMFDGAVVNGSIGIVVSVDPLTVEVSGISYTIEPQEWEKLEYRDVSGKLAKTKTGIFRQIPIRLAWAITIHKSQGQTFDSVYIDLGTRDAFSAGMTYVALSRCRTLEGISLARKLRRGDIKAPRLWK